MPSRIPGISLNCLRTSWTIFIAAFPTDSIANAEKITGIMPPINKAASTSALKIFIPSIPVKVTYAANRASAVSAADEITFASDTVISLASTISAGIVTDARLDFTRYSGGYDRQVYGISVTTSGHYDGSGGKYRTEGGGWVGVTTYIDCHGKLRVKKEILVAMGGSAGISTGDDGIKYPTSVNG